MYTALYRSHRPEVFDEILGQEHIVKILKNQVRSETVSHAYLFCGTRGTGKTTTARILAKAVNCLSEGERPCGKCENCKAIKDGSFMDVIEIDAASNNGVENIRELRESVKYPPSSGRKKVYIIDEVHMLSQGAFNALLKTLEEPPEHVMFILATTEPQKLPQTILSRCMRLDFRRVSQTVIAGGMKTICRERDIEITDDAIRLLANCADGSVRDGLSILDQVLAGGDKYIDREKVLEYVGTTGEEFFIDLTELVSLRKSAEALILLNDVLSEGKDVKQIMKDWVSHYRSLLITKFVSDAEDMLNMSAENLKRVSQQSSRISVEEIDFAVTKLSKTINDARWSTNPRVLLELAIVAIASGGESHTEIKKNLQEKNGDPSETRMETQEEKAQKSVLKSEFNKRKDEGSLAYNEAADLSETVINRSEAAEQDERTVQSGPCIKKESYGALWHSIFEEGEGSAGSFNLIRSGTELHHVGEDNFTVVTNSSFTLRYVEQKRKDIEKLMEQQIGRPMKLICRLKEDLVQQSDEDEEAQKIAREAGQLLGIDIQIE
ncbi:MAG: DNA polymerase III subunit gamma/tau [Clostridiales bacterium]|nr:MAG: DNA polymerase III subunit gamma/tau [Clostridiales bacterium]